MDIDVDTPLVRPTAVTIELSADGSAKMSAGGSTVAATPGLALEVLDAFSQPLSMREAFTRFKTGGSMEHFMAATSLIRDLSAAGILAPEGGPGEPRIPAAADADEIAALDDSTRTTAFLDAIASTVSPGDVVVDIGTGTGLFAMAAARAGASKVYAVERGFASDVAGKVLNDNGFSNRVTLLNPDAAPPEKADVIICDALDNDPFAAGILGLLHDAARQWAKPGARFIPGELTPVITALHIPAEASRAWLLSGDHTAEWSAMYGFSFAALQEDSASHVARTALRHSDIADWAVSDSHALEPLTFSSSLAFSDQAYESAATLPCSGPANAIALSFSAQLDKGTAISTTPATAGLVSSWQPYVFAYVDDLPVTGGELSIRLTATSSGSRIGFAPRP